MEAVGSDVVVFALLRRIERSMGAWARYRATFQSLRYSFPIVVVSKKVKGRVSGKIVAFLKRHEHVWVNMYKLLGWEVVERYEMSLDELEEMYGELRKALEALRYINIKGFPQWLAECLKPSISLGRFSYDEALEFFETIKKKFNEYTEAPKAMKTPRRREPRFHKLLRTSKIAALMIVGMNREEQLKRINVYIYELLSKGIIPIDYSYNIIIVARKTYKHKGVERPWKSTLGLDPVEVLKGFASRYIIVGDVKELEFEKRDVGWGLKPILAF